MSHEPHGNCSGQAGCNDALKPDPQVEAITRLELELAETKKQVEWWSVQWKKASEEREAFRGNYHRVLERADQTAVQLADMTASYEKQRKHNGALEIAIQEAHRDVDEANRLRCQEVEELKRLLDQARLLLTENKMWKEGPWYDRVKTVIERQDGGKKA